MEKIQQAFLQCSGWLIDVSMPLCLNSEHSSHPHQRNEKMQLLSKRQRHYKGNEQMSVGGRLACVVVEWEHAERSLDAFSKEIKWDTSVFLTCHEKPELCLMKTEPFITCKPFKAGMLFSVVKKRNDKQCADVPSIVCNQVIWCC